jgi:hypothetical protein
VSGGLYSLYHPNLVREIISKQDFRVGRALVRIRDRSAKIEPSRLFLFSKDRHQVFPRHDKSFSARYEGHFPDDAVRHLLDHFKSGEFRFPTKVERQDTLSAQVEVDQTLTLNIQFEPAQTSEDQSDHLTVISKVMEVSYGHAKKKLDSQIVPVLQAINDVLKPENASFELDVQFLRRNPFFAVYIAHLRPEQVQDYRVMLHVDAGHATGKTEKVEITKERVHVTAKTTNAFRSIAEQFVLLSPDLKMLKADH